MIRDGLQVEIGERVVLHPRDRRLQRMVGVDGSGVLDVLRLTPVPPRRYHYPSRSLPRQVWAVVLADQVQTQVHPRGDSCRRQDGALVDEQDAGVDVDI